ncbi:hypothetical protein KAT51_01380 [bacterium]|nr:hypothetical protein [bacterium]
MTAVSARLGYVGFVLCLFTISYGILASRSRNIFPVSKTHRSILLHGILVFLAVCLWLKFTLPLLAWLLWIGDNEHWFWNCSTYIALAIALGFVGLVVFRINTNRATLRYVRVLFWCSIALLVIFATFWSYELISPIKGTTPRAAAESYLPKGYALSGESVELVEDQRPNIYPDLNFRKDCKTYWIMGKKEPRGRITVGPYGRFWWTYGSYEGFPPSAEELQRAKESIQYWRHDRDFAQRTLKRIVRNYPGTKAAKEAQELLDTLDE